MSNAISCSEKTKLKMAEALKRLVPVIPFEKITVSDITNECGIHRQTFYYHFQDKYELLDWLLYNELLSPFIDGFNLDNMYDKIFNAFLTIYNEKEFYQYALRVDGGYFSKYVSRIAAEQFGEIVTKLGNDNGIPCQESEGLFLSEFIGFGITGVVVDWVRKGFIETPEQLKQRIICIVESCEKLIIQRND